MRDDPGCITTATFVTTAGESRAAGSWAGTLTFAAALPHSFLNQMICLVGKTIPGWAPGSVLAELMPAAGTSTMSGAAPFQEEKRLR